ncbi:hypothetical protein AB0D59_34525 [Streptomyces sp. NPDC048417]
MQGVGAAALPAPARRLRRETAWELADEPDTYSTHSMPWASPSLFRPL